MVVCCAVEVDLTCDHSSISPAESHFPVDSKWLYVVYTSTLCNYMYIYRSQTDFQNPQGELTVTVAKTHFNQFIRTHMYVHVYTCLHTQPSLLSCLSGLLGWLPSSLIPRPFPQKGLGTRLHVSAILPSSKLEMWAQVPFKAAQFFSHCFEFWVHSRLILGD